MTPEQPEGETTESGMSNVTGPVPWRLGRLTLVFVAIVAVGLLFNSLTADDAPPAEPGSSAEAIDVSAYPTGLLSGEPAPDATFDLFDGTTFDMATHIATDGRPVVLNLWASWCGPCRTEMPEFSDIADVNPDVAFVGVAIGDSRAAAEQFAREVGVSYPLGIDETNDVGGAYPAVGLPATYFIGGDGVVTRQVQGQLSGPFLQAFIDFDFGG